MKMVAKMNHVGLVAHLRHWGLRVDESEGWRFRGRPYNFYPRAVLCHHTASNRHSGNFAAEGIVTNGRLPDLPGPLSQILLGRDGTVKLIAAGYSNHAGYGGPQAGVPANQGNTYAIGIEAENDGIGEAWSREQLNAYYRLCAALMDWLDIKDVEKVFGHKEWTSRKIDPAGIDMNRFREQVKKALAQGPSVQTVRLSRLQPGKRNRDVLRLKKRLHRRGLSTSDETTNFFGKGLRNDYRHWQLRLGYTGADADGIPGKTSLEKLGFRVKP